MTIMVGEEFQHVVSKLQNLRFQYKTFLFDYPDNENSNQVAALPLKFWLCKKPLICTLLNTWNNLHGDCKKCEYLEQSTTVGLPSNFIANQVNSSSANLATLRKPEGPCAGLLTFETVAIIRILNWNKICDAGYSRTKSDSSRIGDRWWRVFRQDIQGFR